MKNPRFFTVIDYSDDLSDLIAIRSANDLVITKHLRTQLNIGVLEANELARALRAVDFTIDADSLETLCLSLEITHSATFADDVEMALDLALAEVGNQSPTGLMVG